jgi:uncharacterized coiled-coil DUF342 family protein
MQQTDQERLNELQQKAADYARKKQEELNEKVASLRSQIENLIHERGEIERGPLTVQETLSVCIHELEKGKKEIFGDLLTRHIKDVQNQRTDFLSGPAIRLTFFADSNMWKLIFAMIDKTDLEKAAAGLESAGALSEIQRREKIDSLNRKIADLEKQIGKLLL